MIGEYAVIGLVTTLGITMTIFIIGGLWNLYKDEKGIVYIIISLPFIIIAIGWFMREIVGIGP